MAILVVVDMQYVPSPIIHSTFKPPLNQFQFPFLLSHYHPLHDIQFAPCNLLPIFISWPPLLQ